MYKVFASISSFSENSSIPKQLCIENNIELIENKYKKKLNEENILSMSKNCHGIIAGTEKISKKVIEGNDKLKVISRVGIGLDNIGLIAAKKNNVKVKNTPDIPSPYLAEMTVGVIISMLRKIHVSNLHMHQGNWFRAYGKSITDSVIGVVGYGRIGQALVKKLQSLEPKEIIIHDILKSEVDSSKNINFVNYDDILHNSDVISFHVPLNNNTKNLLCSSSMAKMKPGSIVVNNSRGGIINENDLYDALKDGHISGAALDVYENEPYNGKLIQLDNCLLTSHIGSMSIECRNEMEIQAVNNIIRTLNIGSKIS